MGENEVEGQVPGRSWREVRAEAMERHPWLNSPEAEQARARMRAETTALICGDDD
ncbi:hypothetical protein [Streptomyces himalayensis]|uniref:Uncharacterized protein n=1 Tax=Streptomyces himalayensis subsp. himalayensis TaxID=2756131 RepID=A0A7W0IBL2_9ACTN|nr:hypothetical protein [Streptomyces himalayensis]MBA2949264.1 hypothetical protein [Streptomyces himalayensis subsp. himalayensis]